VADYNNTEMFYLFPEIIHFRSIGKLIQSLDGDSDRKRTQVAASRNSLPKWF